MQDQDQHLDAMGGTLVNLKEIAGTMNREIDDQVMLVDGQEECCAEFGTKLHLVYWMIWEIM